MSDSSSSRRPLPHSQRSSEPDDVTWLDFLRTAGGTVPADSNASSSDRKRRHTGSSPERRGYPYTAYAPNSTMTGRRPSGTNVPGQAGSSRDNAIDLTSPPRVREQQRPQVPTRTFEEMMATRPAPRPAPRHSSNSGGSMSGGMMPPRRESDIVLPRWQPDSEVNQCPVCHTDFHFFYRKHHCRKCGRVVCAACSPHRITIPKQYIVQPPNSADGEQEPPSPVHGGSSSRNLGGGEVVRVCNPCVPDPWTPEQAPSDQTRPQQVGTGPIRSAVEAANRYGLPNNESAAAEYRRNPPPRMNSGGVRGTMEDLIQRTNESHQRQLDMNNGRFLRELMGDGRARSQSLQQHRGGDQNPYLASPFAFRDPRAEARPPNPQAARHQNHRYTQSSGSGPFPAMPPGQMPQPVPPPPSQLPHAHPRREVREVREEDECPVCGMEMPPGDSVREAHISECINLRSYSAPSSSSLPTHPPSAPPPRTSSMHSTRPPYPNAASTSADGSTSNTNRPRATSYKPRGMAVYKATEKDCMTEDGEPQECVICMEDFQPGDDMGRMECLCKFHRICIRQWWDTKGNGSCPTHQLHD